MRRSTERDDWVLVLPPHPQLSAPLNQFSLISALCIEINKRITSLYACPYIIRICVSHVSLVKHYNAVVYRTMNAYIWGIVAVAFAIALPFELQLAQIGN